MPTLFFDITKSRRQGHLSGLNRVSSRLQDSLKHGEGYSFKRVYWSTLKRSYVEAATGRAVGSGSSGDGFFTPEIFALRERIFCRRWLKRFRGQAATVFYDAIPYIHPEITWPHSVRRFPRWYEDLQAYDHVMFISRHARAEAEAVHEETGWSRVDGAILPMGCDYAEERPERLPEEDPVLLNVGILEPRKGQDCLLKACESMWMEGMRFKLVLLGRVNPHYGRPLLEQIKLQQQAGRDIVHEEQVGDDRLAYWHQRANLAVLPSRAEGFGLPVLEALWTGCPVVASDQPCLDVLPGHKGIRVLEEISATAVEEALKPLLQEPASLEALRAEVAQASLPTWADSARALLQQLGLPASS